MIGTEAMQNRLPEQVQELCFVVAIIAITNPALDRRMPEGGLVDLCAVGADCMARRHVGDRPVNGPVVWETTIQESAVPPWEPTVLLRIRSVDL